MNGWNARPTSRRWMGGLAASVVIVAAATTACGGGPDVTGTGGETMSESGGSGGAGAAAGDSGGSGGATGGMGGAPTGGTGGDPFAKYGAPPKGQTNAADILFVVDNSVSMAPHQDFLSDAAVQFMKKLADPDCVDSGGSRSSAVDGTCPNGTQREFRALDDIRAGVITTSLGGMGSQSCTDGDDDDDQARFIPDIRSGAPDPSGNGYLTYDGDIADLPKLQSDLAAHIAAAGDTGCGYEAQLESIYRFLVDPNPPTRIEVNSSSSLSEPMGLDQDLLDQRNAFLRDDSAVFVVLLSDENDCSVMGGGSHYRNAGFGWLTTEPSSSTRFGRFPVASPTCETDPNDECCFSCLSHTVPDGCEEQYEETCGDSGTPPTLSPSEDRANVRCFEQKRRFGVDLLYPVERYIDGLSKPEIIDGRTGKAMPNRLFIREDGSWRRSPEWVYLTALVGVPWQDLATSSSLSSGSELEMLSSAELTAKSVSSGGKSVSRWDLMIGDTARNVDPYDPFMVESIEPRSGSHPLIAADPIPPTGSGKTPINGHEYDNSVDSGSGPANDNLQYACIYPLGSASLLGCTPEDLACECGSEPDKNRPICKQDPQAQLPATNDQRWAPAYPGRRILQVVEALGEQGVPGSICPKIVDSKSPDFGYRPAVDALSRRLPKTLQ